MSTKHTPGPWIYFAGSHCVHGDMRAVCTIHGPRKHVTPDKVAEREANARLIAAAPDLLAALQAIVSDNDFCGDNYGERRDAWIETARAAIAKATGEQA